MNLAVWPESAQGRVMCTATCTRVSLLLFRASATREPEPLDSTQEIFAVPWRLLDDVPSSACSAALAGTDRGIQEVPPEAFQTSAV